MLWVATKFLPCRKRVKSVRSPERSAKLERAAAPTVGLRVLWRISHGPFEALRRRHDRHAWQGGHQVLQGHAPLLPGLQAGRRRQWPKLRLVARPEAAGVTNLSHDRHDDHQGKKSAAGATWPETKGPSFAQGLSVSCPFQTQFFALELCFKVQAGRVPLLR